MRSLTAIFKLFLFALLVIIVIPTQGLVLLITKGPAAYRIPVLWHSLVTRVLGIKVEIQGTAQINRQTVFVSNHLSYLDIPVLGGILKASFIAKSEVEQWPLFGFLSKLQQTAFIVRNPKALKDQSAALSNMLAAGKNLILFAEGTSTDGRGVYPFKSSLFSLVLAKNDRDVVIQPVTIRLESADKQDPQDQNIRDLYAWHIDMTMSLADHLWRFAKTKGAKITVIFHDALEPSEFENRKTLAKRCEDIVSHSLTS